MVEDLSAAYRHISSLLDDTDDRFPIEYQEVTIPSYELLEQQGEINPVTPETQELPGILRRFKIPVELVEPVAVGPVLTTARIRPHGHIQLSKIKKLENEIAFYLQVPNAHISVDNENGWLNVELPNPVPSPVRLRHLLETMDDELWLTEHPLAFPAGVKPDGSPMWVDLEAMPHLLIGGTTGSGKSIVLHDIIVSYLVRLTPGEIQLALIDPKRGVEFGLYENIPHLFKYAAYTVDDAISLLYQLEEEMERRYAVFRSESYRNIMDYREDGRITPFSRIVCIIDELATVFEDDDSKEMENLVIRMAQLGRAAGIHLILATQRPSHDIITGRIKANFPARVALLTASAVDSRVIMGTPGAEQLLGRGDALFSLPNAPLTRVQTCLVTREEVAKVVGYWMGEETLKIT